MVYMYHSFLIHSSADGHLGCFLVLAFINSAAMNIGVHVSLSDLVSSVCMPRSGIAGSKKTYRWLTNTWKDAQHHSLSEKCKSKPQWGTITRQLGCFVFFCVGCHNSIQKSFFSESFDSGQYSFQLMNQWRSLPIL